MKIHHAELRSLTGSLPWKVDADDARELDAGFDKFVEQASARLAVPSLYVTKAAHFPTLVPEAFQGGDAWVLWLPHLDPMEIDDLARQLPTTLHSPTRTRDVRLAWRTALWCFMAYESSVSTSVGDAYKLGYVTVIIANATRVAVNAVRVDDDLVVELLMGGQALRRDPDNCDADSEGRLLIELRPEPYRPKGIA